MCETVWKSIVDGVESTRLRHFVLNRAPRRHRASRVAIEQVASMAQVWNGLIYARKPGNPILKAVIEFTRFIHASSSASSSTNWL